MSLVTPHNPHGPLLRVDAVIQKTSLRRSTLYAMIAEKRFPSPVKLGGAARWLGHEIDAWIEARIAERDQRAA